MFPLRAFDRRLARPPPIIGSGVSIGDNIYPPAPRVRLDTPAPRGLNETI